MAQEREVVVKITPKVGDTSAFQEMEKAAKKVADAMTPPQLNRSGPSQWQATMADFKSMSQGADKAFSSTMQLSRGIALLTGNNKSMEQLVTTFLRFQAINDVLKGTVNVIKDVTGLLRTFTGETQAAATATNALQTSQAKLAATRGAQGATAAAPGIGQQAGSMAPAAAMVAPSLMGGGATGTTPVAAGASLAAPVALALVSVVTAAAVVALKANIFGITDIATSILAGTRQSHEAQRAMQATHAIGMRTGLLNSSANQQSQFVSGIQNPVFDQIRSVEDRRFEMNLQTRMAPVRLQEQLAQRQDIYTPHRIGLAQERFGYAGGSNRDLQANVGRVMQEQAAADAISQQRFAAHGAGGATLQAADARVQRIQGNLSEIGQQVGVAENRQNMMQQIGLLRQQQQQSVYVNPNANINAQGTAAAPMWGPWGTGVFGTGIGPRFGFMSATHPGSMQATGYTAPAGNNLIPGGGGQAFANSSQIYEHVMQQARQQAANTNSLFPSPSGDGITAEQMVGAGNVQGVSGNLMQIAQREQQIRNLQQQIENLPQVNMAAGGGLGGQAGAATANADNLTPQEQLNTLMERRLALNQQLAQAEEGRAQAVQQEREEQGRILEQERQRWHEQAEAFRQQAQQLRNQTMGDAERWGMMDEGSQRFYGDIMQRMSQGGNLTFQEMQALQGSGLSMGNDMVSSWARDRTAQDPAFARLLDMARPGDLSRNQQVQTLDQAATTARQNEQRIELRIQNELRLSATDVATSLTQQLNQVFDQLANRLAGIIQQRIQSALSQQTISTNTAVNGGGN